LAAALAFTWWHSRQTQSNSEQRGSSQTATGNASPKSGDATQPLPADTEPVLASVQLTPQRMQSIGVKLGTAQIKTVTNDIRVTGNVDVNERQVATVQVGFRGWIRKVYADATYDYVKKGQPLFTIYSPDLVTTQREYLLARKNQQDVKQSSIDGVSTGADTLVSAARERLQQWEVPASEI